MAADPSPFERLWHEYRATGRIGAQPDLARQTLRLLTAIAHRVRRSLAGRPALDDLVSAGAVGLLEALQRFDPARGVRLKTFAHWRIVGSMIDEHHKAGWAPAALRLKALRARAAAREMTAALGRPPSDAEVAEALGVSTADLAEARRAADRPVPRSLAGMETANGGRGMGRSQSGPADRRRDPLRLLLAAKARTLLLDAVKTLPDKPRYTLLLYYFERLTLAQIGRVLGLSEGRVCQIRDEALRRLVFRLGPDARELLDTLGE